MRALAASQQHVQYVAFDKKTGAIVATYARLDAQTGTYVEVPVDEVRAEMAKDTSVSARLTDRRGDNLGIIAVTPEARPKGTGPMAVDVTTEKLVFRPTLALKAQKPELAGNGADTTVIEIQAVDAAGKRVRSLDDDIRVTTDRGKLSERGGLIKLKQGQGTIELTSVNETVRRVRVRAQSLSARASPGETVLEFV